MRLLFSFVVGLVLMSFGGCARQQPMGMMITADSKEGFDLSYDIRAKECYINVLGFGYFAPPNVTDVARKNSIGRVKDFEYRSTSFVFGAKLCTYVYGDVDNKHKNKK